MAELHEARAPEATRARRGRVARASPTQPSTWAEARERAEAREWRKRRCGRGRRGLDAGLVGRVSGPGRIAVDASKWNYDVGGGDHGWGNNELEYYTSGTENAVIENDMLVITASSLGASKFYTCFYGDSLHVHVGAAHRRADKFAQRYGRLEARITFPAGHGLWPAFWMLG